MEATNEDKKVELWLVPEIGEGRSKREPTKQELDNLRKEAKEQGFNEGKKEGLEKATAEINEKKKQLDSLLEALGAPLRIVDEEVEETLKELVIAVSSHLLRKEFNGDPELILNVIKEAKSLLMAPGRKLLVYLNPVDLELISEKKDSIESCQFLEDNDLESGDCYVRTESAEVNARLETRLRALLEKDDSESE